MVPGSTPPAALGSSGERPWSKDVSPERQQAALAAFAAGNAAFVESNYAGAFVQYREALKWWDHPAIHYNAAVALINLDQPLPAYEHLEAALAWGEAPLGEDNQRQAILYRRLLSGQLAQIEISCEEPGSEVMLDGKTLFRAPGRTWRRLLPGVYQVVARKPGYLTETRTLQVLAGKLTRESVTLHPVGVVAMHPVRRWATWKPWAVFGAGALVGLVGIPLFLDGRSNMRTFDSEIARLCPAGCREADLPSTVLSARDRGRFENEVAVGLFVAGGVVAATGIVLLVANQARLEPDAAPVSGIGIAPLVGSGRAGATASLRF